MSLFGPIAYTREIMEDAGAKCDRCGSPATGGYVLSWMVFACCDEFECHKACQSAVRRVVSRELECHP